MLEILPCFSCEIKRTGRKALINGSTEVEFSAPYKISTLVESGKT